MTTETPTPRRRRSMLFGVSRALLLPRDAVNVPGPIAEANERAWTKLEAYEAASLARVRAGQIAEAAPVHDQNAVAAALAADERPPKHTAPAKQQKAEAARREVDAAETVAKRAILELWDVVAEHHTEYLEGREAAYAEAIEAPSKALDAFESSLASVDREAELLDLARAWHNNVRSAALTSNGRSPGDRMAKAERDLELRRRHRQTIDIPDRPEHLLAALRRHIEERLAG